ncbi:MAG: NTP transferase domain-containing protein [Opitutales bacterium]|nr:NTP transferase domain-containing protein [Opitutales bacterium]
MKPSLVVLAAGMGSRYGGLKQLERFGKANKTLLEYSIEDAAKAGFGKVVFIIRKDFEQQFRDQIICGIGETMDTAIVFQQLDDLPAPYKVPEGRAKPWGTGQAVLAAKQAVKEPFCVINADDFYGEEAFALMSEMLKEREESRGNWAMVAYKLERTLSENGSVSRGVCEISAEGSLISIEEHTKLFREHSRILSEMDGRLEEIKADTPVSMNFFGFTPDLFEVLQQGFADFLKDHGHESKSEYYLPLAVNTCISNGTARVEVARTNGEWIGVTYPEDRESANRRIDALHKIGHSS